MRTAKRSIAILTGAVLSVGFMAGCSDDKTEGSGDASATATAAEETTEAATEEATEPVTLRMLANVTPVLTEEWYQEWAQPWLDAHPNVTLEVDGPTAEGVEQQFQQEIAAQDVPDIISGGMGKTTASQLVDLSAYDWATGDIPGTTYNGDNGVIFGIAPAVQIQSLVYYNEDVWTAAGITEQPKSLDEFTEALRAIKAYDSSIIPLLLSGEWTTQAEVNEMAVPSVMGSTDQLAAIADGSLQVADSAYAPYFEAVETWVAEGLVSPDAAAITYDDSLSMFSTGEAATYVMGAWAVSTINELNTTFTAKVMETPTPEGTTGHAQYGNPAVGVYVPKDGANVDLALDLAKYLTTDTEAVTKACVVEGNFAKGVTYESTPLGEEVNAIYGAASGLVAVDTALPGFMDQVGVPVQSILTGDFTAAQALDELQSWVDQNRG
ncbi:MAG: ABC transporter substrate-binding protein [Bifidobacteriaceae bacterium]|jgi:multiple sugar transport system substrate-binding protein/raffinose/stachyose/melibiose transport system substrate-binding protein|nr:ABC transporter substrate-binding protein [Bifidobacteriaceae bacterium]